ncbi:MAG: DUF4339 domain-containing protein [Deltaproteobacteria bacterium]|nr:DUF4339 domain-containing protein [Deltaproteobacteria bacterium]
MATGEIFIQIRGKNYGPYNEAALSKHIKAGRVPFSAWVFFDDNWRLLAEVAELRRTHPDYFEVDKERPSAAASAEKLEQPKAEPAGGAATVSAEPVWFFIREKKKFGPYSAAELVGQLQRKELSPATYVWRPGFDTWQKMSGVSEFSRDAMKRLASDVDNVPFDILVKRKYTRAPYEVEVIAHDNTKAIEGRTMVIGEGGLFLTTRRPSHAVGARLKLHFREGGTPSFNAVAEVVSVVRGETPGYCLRFVALSDGDRRRIAKFVSDRK